MVTSITFSHTIISPLIGVDPSTADGANLDTLFKRKRGELLRVGENGHLVKVEGPKAWLSYQWNRQEERAKVKEVVDAALETLNAAMERDENAMVADAAAHKLFNKQGEEGIGRLSQSLYNPDLVRGHNRLSKALLPEHTVRVKIGDKFHDITNNTNKLIDIRKDEAFITIELGDRTANHNLWKLIVRKPGEQYQSGPETGRTDDEINQEVQKIVTDVMQRLNDSLPLDVSEVATAHRYALNAIFDPNGSICRLNRNLFDRGVIAEGSKLEEILHEGLQKKREALAEALMGLRDADEHHVKQSKLAVEKAFMDLVGVEVGEA